MAIIINQIKTPLGTDRDIIISKALKQAHIRQSDVESSDIYKTSIDARDNENIKLVHSVFLELKSKELEKKLLAKNTGISSAAEGRIEPEFGKVHKNGRVTVVGFGPAGMFCALILARYGYKPLVLERGGQIDERVKKVERYLCGGALDIGSNIQFGEGGAGTFSDGKLTCRNKDELCRLVLEEFVRFGAPDEILKKAKPHIGTDKLRGVVKAIRQEIEALGGEVRFNTRLDDIKTEGGKLTALLTGGEKVECSALVLAIGHSARDTFEMLVQKDVFIEPKPFSVGARIEHLQEDIDLSLYGKSAGDPVLPKGEYQLSYRSKEGRGVYTFCMCPGGYVMPSASEEKTTVTNGMSEFARDGKNANAAVVVSVTHDDFGKGMLDGMNFAREIEKRAFALTGEKAPACTVGGFLNGKAGLSDKIEPTYSRGVAAADFEKLFPKLITDMMKTGLYEFSKKMKAFGDNDALLTAPETRTSSPVRITRGDNRQAIGIGGIYPCGEGAGYAGGIMSAAVDGIKTALAIMKEQSPD